MSHGYDTQLGERGGKLSTGQRQRLSIARAVVRDTPILILDEPTASLDAETEHQVLANLASWGRERIVFLITHRLSTIRNADQIAFLEDGEIVELGDHDTLMAKPDGRYRRFVTAEIEAAPASEIPDGRVALTHVNLTLTPGELVAIVGPTGAGKTSLAFLIPAYICPTSGRVLFNGRDTREVNLDTLRDQVSYVFQEHVLMSESIRANMLLVNPQASESDMRTALTTAGVIDFVDELPDGIDTVLGRSGDTLSVGQKQRLCIARGLIRDTSVLILDEPTAALDPHTENALVRALRAAAKDQLVIIIAHRLSTIRQADRIVFLEEGEIKDVGSHDELMAEANSRYRHFVELQRGA